MRRLFVILLVSIGISLYSTAQISVGIRDNRFVNVAFLYKKHYSVKLEQSIFAESIGLQYMRGYLGYQFNPGLFDIKGNLYFGSSFNRMYFSTGMSADIRFRLHKIFFINGCINPHYDSGYGYRTCYYGGIGFRISKNIDLLAAYSNIPEYRVPEERLNLGFDFHVKNLKVIPRLSLNVGSNSGTKTIRPLINFEYTFNNRTHHE